MPSLQEMTWRWAVAALIAVWLSSLVLGQEPVKPVTVCEVLGNPKAFSGRPVVIVGLLECDWSVIDHTCYLAEDRCDRPVTTEGYVWPNKILLAGYWEEGMPRPPTRKPKVDSAAVFQKIQFLRTTTTLGFHKEPRFKTEGDTITSFEMTDVKDEWGVEYGNLFTARTLKKDGCDSDEVGCGGFQGAPVALIMKSEALQTYKDEAVPKVQATEQTPHGSSAKITPPKGVTKVRGRYTNVDYGYSVDIPAGLVGERSAAPNPNHGFAITLSPKSVVWVDASYEMEDTPETLGKLDSRLGTLKAARKSWKTMEGGREELHQSVVARGSGGIIYTIQVDTTSEQKDSAYRIFEAVVRSFRTIPIRP
jgi:hypothetical protein